jgi:hypothetical protein
MGAPSPAADFAARFTVPLAALRAGRWWRLAPIARSDPVDWDGRPGQSRFVANTGGMEVLYLATDKPTAFWEVFAARLLPLAPEDRVLPPAALEQRRWVQVEVPKGLRVFDATSVRALRAIGASNMCFHGDWADSQRWAAALWAHPNAPAGILYRSDKNPRNCVAIFRRASAGVKTIKGRLDGLLGDDDAFLAAMRRDRHIAGPK